MLTLHEQARIFASDLTPPERLVMLCLGYHRNSVTGQCNPTREMVAIETGLSLATVRRVKKSLIDKGWILSHSHGRASFYSLEWGHSDPSEGSPRPPNIERTKSRKKRRREEKETHGPMGERLPTNLEETKPQ